MRESIQDTIQQLSSQKELTSPKPKTQHQFDSDAIMLKIFKLAQLTLLTLTLAAILPDGAPVLRNKDIPQKNRPPTSSRVPPASFRSAHNLFIYRSDRATYDIHSSHPVVVQQQDQHTCFVIGNILLPLQYNITLADVTTCHCDNNESIFVTFYQPNTHLLLTITSLFRFAPLS